MLRMASCASCTICASKKTQLEPASSGGSCKHSLLFCLDCLRKNIDVEVNGKGNTRIRCPAARPAAK